MQQQFQLFADPACPQCGGGRQRRNCRACNGTGTPPGEDPVFLLGARKRRKTKLPYYAVTNDAEDASCKGNAGFIGKLHSSDVLGLRWEVSRRIAGSGNAEADAYADDADYRPQATFAYERNILGSNGPRDITGEIADASDGPSRRFVTKRPRWSEKQREFFFFFLLLLSSFLFLLSSFFFSFFFLLLIFFFFLLFLLPLKSSSHTPRLLPQRCTS